MQTESPPRTRRTNNGKGAPKRRTKMLGGAKQAALAASNIITGYLPTMDPTSPLSLTVMVPDGGEVPAFWDDVNNVYFTEGVELRYSSTVAQDVTLQITMPTDWEIVGLTPNLNNQFEFTISADTINLALQLRKATIIGMFFWNSNLQMFHDPGTRVTPPPS